MTFRTTEGDASRIERGGVSTSEPPSTRIALQLAEATGEPVDELEPLAETVDPEALDALFEAGSQPDAHVTFTHEGYAVTVTGDGDVLIDPVEGR